jgi:hypothetical protein
VLGKTYYYRVKAVREGYTDSPYTVGSLGCAVPGSTKVAMPGSMAVPSSNDTGAFTVSWGKSSTIGAKYLLVEATNESFTEGVNFAYFGKALEANIAGRTPGMTYYYKVKAIKTGMKDSAFRLAGNGCLLVDLNTVDNDGDGFTENDGDCNDAIANSYPGATEICGDGIDQSCAGGDLACPSAVSDYDGDGYTIDQGDCDDFNAEVHPGGVDVASDGYDQDCDGHYNGDEVVMAPGAITLDAPTESSISSISPDGRITFSGGTDQIAGFTVGNPLLIGITPKTPLGFMGKIASIETGENGQIIVTTVPAALDEVFETLRIVRKGSLGTSDAPAGAAQIAPLSMVSPSAVISGHAAYQDCMDASPGAGLVNEFCLAMQTGYSLDIDINLFEPSRFIFEASPSATLTNTFGAEAEVSATLFEKEFPRVRYPPIPLGVPGLFMTPFLGASLQVTADAKGKATITTTRNVAYDAQLSYANEIWSKNLVQTKDTRNITHEIYASAGVAATLSPEIRLFINAVAGPYLQVDLSARAQADTCANPWLKAFVKADYSIGAKVRLLKDLDYEFNNGSIIPETIYWQSTEPFPYFGTVRGIVQDQVGDLIEGVNVDFLKDGEIKATAATDISGSYSLDLGPCYYEVKFSHCALDDIIENIDNIVVGQELEFNEMMIVKTGIFDGRYYYYFHEILPGGIAYHQDSYTVNGGTITGQSQTIINNNEGTNTYYKTCNISGTVDIATGNFSGSLTKTTSDTTPEGTVIQYSTMSGYLGMTDNCTDAYLDWESNIGCGTEASLQGWKVYRQ